ncbi:hypothetical protein [Klebsiella aerogenes]|uniref:hypothetical protein n=1 Tax=Klebsiella aerogenes TaxID=548 RepID=UPI0030EE6A57
MKIDDYGDLHKAPTETPRCMRISRPNGESFRLLEVKNAQKNEGTKGLSGSGLSDSYFFWYFSLPMLALAAWWLFYIRWIITGVAVIELCLLVTIAAWQFEHYR